MNFLDALCIKTHVMANSAMTSLADKAKYVLADEGTDNGWDINKVLTNTSELLRTVGSLFMVVLGVIMIIVGIFKIAQGMISHGKTQVNWVINILLIVVGALFCAGGAFFQTMTSSDNNSFGAAIADTLNGLGN